jgi:hypothetical protein
MVVWMADRWAVWLADYSVEWLVDEKVEWMVAQWGQLLADCSVGTKVSSMAGRLVAW